MLKFENLPYFESEQKFIKTKFQESKLLNQYFLEIQKTQHPKSINFLSKNLDFNLKSKIKFSALFYKSLPINFKLVYGLKLTFSFFKIKQTKNKDISKFKIVSLQKFRKLLKEKRKLKLILKKKKLKKRIKTFKQAEIIITKRLNNTFLTFIDKYSKKCLIVISAGLCKFKNSKKRSPFTEETIAKYFMKRISSFNYKIIDIVFKTKVTKILQFLFKGLSDSKKFKIRYLIYKKPFPFGYVRHKKIRRI